jgi:hypothetical protein
MFRTQFRILSTLLTLTALGLMDTTSGAPAAGGTGSSGGTGGEGGGGDAAGNNSGGDNAGSGDGTGWTGTFDAERAQRAIAAAREDAKKAKAEKGTIAQQLAGVLSALGLKPDGSQDPAELLKAATAERDAEREKARATATELAVFKIASKPEIGANAAALLDSRGFMAKIAELDHNSDKFADKVESAIKKAIEEDAAKYKANGTVPPKAPPASTGAGSFNGGASTAPGEPRSAHERLTRAYAAAAQNQT